MLLSNRDESSIDWAEEKYHVAFSILLFTADESNSTSSPPSRWEAQAYTLKIVIYIIKNENIRIALACILSVLISILSTTYKNASDFFPYL
jgi:hypothetical protein